jgi:hypothetical protein
MWAMDKANPGEQIVPWSEVIPLRVEEWGVTSNIIREVQKSAVQYSTAQYNKTVLYSTVQYSTVQQLRSSQSDIQGQIGS